MKANESALDRVIRVVLGLALGVTYILHLFTGTLGIIALVLGILLLVTGLVGYCPLYSLLKIKTK